MQQTNTDYTLTADDMAAFKALLKLQGDVGPGMPTPGAAELFDFFGVIKDMAYDRYRLTTNAQLKGWMDAVFHVVITCDTSYNIDGKSLTGTGMFLLYMFYQFNADCMSTGELMPHHLPGEIAYPPNVLPQHTGKWLTVTNEGLDGAWTWDFLALLQCPVLLPLLRCLLFMSPVMQTLNC